MTIGPKNTCAEERRLAKQAQDRGFDFPFRLLLWRRAEIENYLIEPDALCSAAAVEAARSGKLSTWSALEVDFRAFLKQQISSQKDTVTERLAARIQDRDRRQNLTSAMAKARQIMDAEWGDGIAWCDAKKVLSAARQYLQQRGIAAQALSHGNIIDAMTQLPQDVTKLVKALEKLASQDAQAGRRKKRSAE